MKIKDYEQLQPIHKDDDRVLYSAVRQSDQRLVLIKQLQESTLNPTKLGQLKREHSLLGNLDWPQIPKVIEYIEDQAYPSLVLDVGTPDQIESWPEDYSPPLTDCVELGCQLIRIIDYVHNQNVIIKHLNPSHLCLTKPPLKLILAELDGANLRYSNRKLATESFSDTYITYRAPELNGLSNRRIDYRSDYFSFGVVLYQLCTGNLPYADDGLNQRVSLTKTPIAPHRLNPAIPQFLSNIILRLINFLPENRYQSSYSIIHDLDICISLLANPDRYPNEPVIGLDDIPEHLAIRETLLERDSQVLTMLNCYQKVKQGMQSVVVVRGDSGTGKTALLKELRAKIPPGDVFFIIGKHNPITKTKPYTALASALKDLAEQLSCYPNFPVMREKLTAKFNQDFTILESICPEFVSLFQLEEPIKPSKDNSTVYSHRLASIMTYLCQVLSEENKVIVLCIENLQWVDHASIELFTSLLKQTYSPTFLLAATYQTNKKTEDKSIQHLLNDLIAEAPSISLVDCQNLSLSSLRQLISTTLFRPFEETESLAELLHAKTAGNPLAVREFLHRIVEKELLYFNTLHREWEWSLDKIEAEAPVDSLSEALSHEVNRLDEVSIDLLQIAACVGDEVEERLLTSLSRFDTKLMLSTLSALIEAGFLNIESRRAIDGAQNTFNFSHESIQQAIYADISPKVLATIHNNIGLYYLKDSAADENVFSIVNQLNIKWDIQLGIDAQSLAQLNIRAATKAKQTAAFQASLGYFKKALSLFSENGWGTTHAFDLHLQTAETAFLSGDEGYFDQLVMQIESEIGSSYERALLAEIKLKALLAKNQFNDALKLSSSTLRDLGYPIENQSNSFARFVNLRRLNFDVVRISKTKLPAQSLKKPRALDAALKILNLMSQAGFLCGSVDTDRYVLKIIQLCLKHNMPSEMLPTLPLFGALLISQTGNSKFAIPIQEVIRHLDDKIHDHSQARIISLNEYFIQCWTAPIKNSMSELQRASQLGLESGDFAFSQFSSTIACINSFLVGHELSAIFLNLETQIQRGRELNQDSMVILGSIYQQSIANLIEPVAAPWLLEGNLFSENQFIQFQQGQDNELCLCHLYISKLILASLFDHKEHALSFAQEARKVLGFVAASSIMPFFLLYEGLACLNRLDQANGTEFLRLKLRIRQNLAALKQLAATTPENSSASFHLLQAELFRSNSNSAKAIDHYDKAIQAASKSEFLREHGFACELAGRHYINIGNLDLGHYYFRKSRKSFIHWGAISKVKMLESEFSELTVSNSGDHQPNRSLQSYNTSLSNYGDYLDLGSVIRASQLLAGEVDLPKLLGQFTELALNSAEAHRANLILSTNNELYLEICSTRTSITIRHDLQKTRLDLTNTFPKSVINYVARTQEDLILNDPVNDDIFTEDEYILRNQPGSIFCIPILSQSHLTGILYLENRKSNRAFSPDKIAVLKLLSSQAAIAIENTKLYEELNESRNKYLSLYQNAVEGIFELSMRGELITINPAASELTGFLPTVENQPLQRINLKKVFVRDKDLKIFVRTLFEQKKLFDFETQIRHRDGSERWVSLSAKIIRNNTGKSHHIEASLIDITERKRREDAEQAKQIAETAADTKSQFLASMSHEIRTPMNAIIGYTDLVLRTPLNPVQSGYLSTIKASSSHLLRVVNDILDLSKVESGKLELQNVDLKLAEIFEDLNNLFALEASKKNISLNFTELGGDEAQTFSGDPVRLGQILINLVGNAIKFTHEGEVRVEVSAKFLSQDKVQLNFTIGDTGIGISPENLDAIFESFTQDGRITNESGTGLGLTICQRLVEMMKGKIHVSSQLGQGSTFYFSINVQPMTQDGDSATKDDAASEQAASSDARLLLVEDNVINQNLAQEILSNAGYHVTIANHGQEALDILEEQSFSAILMDLRMPVMNGIEAVKAIRATPQISHLPIFALSAGVLQTEIDEALSAGFDQYITKPIDFEALLLLIAEIPGSIDSSIESSSDGTMEIGQPSQPALEVIQGIDFNKGLGAHDQDQNLLIRLSGEFVRIYSDAHNTLMDYVSDNNTEKAERLVHNIAGVSGSFGAMDLMEASRVIEHALGRQENPSSESLKIFDSELSNLVSAIQILQENNPIDARSH